MTPQEAFREHMLFHINVQLSTANMTTYTELREALAEALRKMPAVDIAPLLPVLNRAGGEL
jgi:hypothetical protein